jgi:hypothetical protein
MITFKKVKELIERFDTSGYFLVRELTSDKNLSEYTDCEIIDEIINSKFHHWRGEEEPGGLSISVSTNNKSKNLINYKIYGFFDNNKLSSVHYKSLAFEEFKNNIFESILELADLEDSLEIKVKKIIKNLNTESTYYHLALNEEINTDLIAEWTPYSVFSAYISIDQKNNLATLIESGQD